MKVLVIFMMRLLINWLVNAAENFTNFSGHSSQERTYWSYLATVRPPWIVKWIFEQAFPTGKLCEHFVIKMGMVRPIDTSLEGIQLEQLMSHYITRTAVSTVAKYDRRLLDEMPLKKARHLTVQFWAQRLTTLYKFYPPVGVLTAEVITISLLSPEGHTSPKEKVWSACDRWVSNNCQ